MLVCESWGWRDVHRLVAKVVKQTTGRVSVALSGCDTVISALRSEHFTLCQWILLFCEGPNSRLSVPHACHTFKLEDFPRLSLKAHTSLF